MRNRSLCLPLFASLVLLPNPVAATPITVSYSDQFSSQASMAVSNTTYLNVYTYSFQTQVYVPKFDPALGTLLSASLTLTGGMSALMVHHAELYVPGFVVSGASVTASANLSPDLKLQSLIGADPILHVNYGFSGISDQSSGLFDTPFAESERTLTDTYFFQQSYTGAGLQPFIGTSPFDVFTLDQSGQSMLWFTGTHEGVPNNGMLDFSTKAGTAPNISTTSPISAGTLVSMAVLAAQLMNTQVDHGGLLGYSDVHVSASAIYGLNATYTYEPAAAAVPEPGTLALLGAGLLVVARSVRRKQLATGQPTTNN